MCTVTYFQTKEGIILTSNRDEHIGRKPSSQPDFETYSGQKLLYPKDQEASGSWIFASDKSRIVCLLNGAFLKHKHEPPYRMSRGIVLKNMLEYKTVEDFANSYDLSNIEPFTVVHISNEVQDGLVLQEFRWDGKNCHISNLDPCSAHIWSSSTLYNPEQTKERADWFEIFFKDENQWNSKSILKFHNEGGASSADKSYQINMSRENGVKTISTTQVIMKTEVVEMQHNNRFTNTTSSQLLDLKVNAFN